MVKYSKSFQDYFRIPVLLRPIGCPPAKSVRLCELLNQFGVSLPVDQKYLRDEANPHTQILLRRPQCTQKLLFRNEEFANNWPELEIIYKCKFAIGVIQENTQDIKDNLQRIRRVFKDQGIKLIGIIFLHCQIQLDIFKEENCVVIPDTIPQHDLLVFLEPWLYTCLSIMESEMCSNIAELKNEDNTVILFNKNEEKTEAKIIKRKKKSRCSKVCADYHLMLHLYSEAYTLYTQAEEYLKKIDDYLWVLGCLQGRITCMTVQLEWQAPKNPQLVQDLIQESQTVSKKTKSWSFECENSFKIFKLYLSQSEKFDEIIRSFLTSNIKHYTEDEKFSLYSYVGYLYGEAKMLRKKNYYYFLAASIYVDRIPELTTILFSDIKESTKIQEWPEIYSKVLEYLMDSRSKNKNGEICLEMLSKCSQCLSSKQKKILVQFLNFSHFQAVNLSTFDIFEVKDFFCLESKVKPKLNRIGNRESPRKGPGFFMSWKKEQILLFEEGEPAVFVGTIVNKINFPLRIKLNLLSSSEQKKEQLASPLTISTGEDSPHKFSRQVVLPGVPEQILVIDRLEISLWNFRFIQRLPNPIRYELYRKQPSLQLIVPPIIIIEESAQVSFAARLHFREGQFQCSTIKISIAIYYSVDVGFQQNEYVLSADSNFGGIDFNKRANVVIKQSIEGSSIQVRESVLILKLKPFKADRRHITKVESSLQYVCSSSSKYQICKQYVSQCRINRSLWCSVEAVTAPGELVWSQNAHVISQHFIMRIKIEKSADDLTPYKIHLNGDEFLLSSNPYVVVSIKKFKLIKKQDISLAIHWESMLREFQGDLELVVPFQDIMLKSDKTVKVDISEVAFMTGGRKQIKVTYSVTGINISHHCALRSCEGIYEQPSYVCRGKVKVVTQETKVANSIRLEFQGDEKRGYTFYLSFLDGELYQNSQLVQLQ